MRTPKPTTLITALTGLIIAVNSTLTLLLDHHRGEVIKKVEGNSAEARDDLWNEVNYLHRVSGAATNPAWSEGR